MTTATMTYNRPPNIGKWLCLTAAAVIVCAVAVQLNFHAILNHNKDAEAVHQCLNKFGPYMTGWLQNRRYQLCQIEPNHWGIHVTAKNADGTWNEVTAFIYRKGKGAGLQKVIDYLVRRGVVFR